MAKLLNTDGTAIEISPANGKTFTLAEAQAMVGGYVELFDIGFQKKHGQNGEDVVLTSDFEQVEPTVEDTFIVNEDGISLDLEVNHVASLLANCVLLGPVVLCKKSEFR